MSETLMARNPLDDAGRATIAGIFSLKDNADKLAFECCTPGIVLSYDRTAGYAVVRPLVKKVAGDGTVQERAPMRLPVRRFAHGSFSFDAPLHEGDTGWIIAGDRDTMNAIAHNAKIQAADSGIGKHDRQGFPVGNEGPQIPSVYSSHKFIFGFFLPDSWGGIPLPAELADSLVLQQVSPDGASHARFAIDPDGTVRLYSTGWINARKGSISGGRIIADLSWRGRLPTEPADTWREGDIEAIANWAVRGNAVVEEWKDPDGKAHGGTLTVAKDAEIGRSLTVGLWATIKGALTVLGTTIFRKRVVVKEDSKEVVIDPKRDLEKSGAKFREILVVTGLEHDRDNANKVALKIQKMRALVDMPEQRDPIEFSVGGGGTGGMNLVKGADTNIVFTPLGNGETAVDVYYI